MGGTTPGPTWVRGVARIVEGEIALDDRTIETYPAAASPDLLAAFLAIEDEVDTARFASRFGLLRTRAGLLREPLTAWWLERDVLRGAMALAHDLSEATAAEEGPAAVLAAWEATALSAPRTPTAPSALIVSDPIGSDPVAAVAEAFRRGLGGVRLLLEPASTGPAAFALTPTAETLVGLVYVEAARLVASGAASRCPECGIVFEAHHARQAYCTPQHASRARFRRFRDRSRATAAV